MRWKSTDMLTSAKTLLLACAFSVMFAGASYADTSTPSNLPKEETTQKETTSGTTTKQETNKPAAEQGAAAAKPPSAQQTQPATTQQTQPVTTQQTQPAATQQTQPAATQKNGWVQDSAGWMYYEAGDVVTDEWRTKDGSDRYLGPDGYMVKKEKIYEKMIILKMMN